MGNIINLPNISPEAIENLTFEVEKDNARGTVFNKLNYLNTRLEGDEKSKTLTIRLLPMDLQTGSPFVKASFHSIKVDPSISKSGWKSFLCLQRNPEIDHEKFGNRCPFCEMNKKAYEESLKETDELKKKNLQKLSLDNHHKDAIIARCIERGHENEGVKFWKFNLSSRKNDPYHQIMDLYSQDKKESEQRGIQSNIFDLYNGFDIILTIKKNETNEKDAFTATNVSIARYPSPLSANEEDMRKWIYDEKKWTDVFVAKPYEYMKLISENRIPWFDKTTGKWIDKEEFENGKSNAEHQINEEIRAAEESLRGYASQPVQAFSDQVPQPAQVYVSAVPQQAPVYVNPVQQPQQSDFMSKMTIKDEDLPF